MIFTFMFLLREAWLNGFRQRLMILACVTTTAVALTTLGGFALLAWHVHLIADALPRRIEVHIFVRPTVPRTRVNELLAALQRAPGVSRVRLVPREIAWQEFKKSWPGPDVLDGLNENPLPDKIEVVTTSPDRTLTLAREVRAWPESESVRDGAQVLQRLLAVAGFIRAGGLVAAVLLALGAAWMVGNAIRLTLHARRRDIRVMQLVGATNAFIRLPFIIEGTTAGTIGGVIAGALLAAGLTHLSNTLLPEIPLVSELQLAIDPMLVGGSLAIAGAVLGLTGSIVSVRRYLTLD